jgi:hypothetical protein
MSENQSDREGFGLDPCGSNIGISRIDRTKAGSSHVSASAAHTILIWNEVIVNEQCLDGRPTQAAPTSGAIKFVDQSECNLGSILRTSANPCELLPGIVQYR